MLGMECKPYAYVTSTGVYIIHVHENCECKDRSHHISAMQPALDPNIRETTDLAARMRRLEGVVAVTMVADRHFVVEMRMPWDSIESDVLNILNQQLDLDYLIQSLIGQNKLNNKDQITVDRTLDPTMKGYFSQHDPKLWLRQPDGQRGDSDVMIDGDSLNSSLAGMITSMGGIADETPRDKYRDRLKDMLSIKKFGPGSPPTSWGFEDGGKYARPR